MKPSIVICSFNEEKTISDVVISCCTLNPGCEVIVVDDGSTDNTCSILNDLHLKYTFRIERFEENRGKSQAMARGVEISLNDIILFIDADISNIKKEHFDIMLDPVKHGFADMVLGQPSETLIDYRVNPFRVFTGERALFKKDITPILDDLRDTRFGIETFLNLYYQAKGKKIKYVLLKNLKHPTTFEKSGSFYSATRKYFFEGKEIAKTILDNQYLIRQRVEITISKTNIQAKKNLESLQQDLNMKIQNLKDKLEGLISAEK